MSSLKANFNELMERIKAGREFVHASFEPIFYLVFSPEQIIEVKRQMQAWMARLKNDGWKVKTFSIASEINKILEDAPVRKIWLAADAKAPCNGIKLIKHWPMRLITEHCKPGWKKSWRALKEMLEIYC